jgi:endoglucanase
MWDSKLRLPMADSLLSNRILPVATLWLLLIAPCAAAESAGTAKAPTGDPFLKTAGVEIRNGRGRGDVVSLRGVNLGGWLLWEEWMCPMDSSGLKDALSARETLVSRFKEATADELIAVYEEAWITEQDLDNIAALGMNVVRVPFWYPNLLKEDGTWRTNAFDRLDWVVGKAWQRGIYMILDLHGAPGGQSKEQTTGAVRAQAELWGNDLNRRRTIEIWQRVAQHYKGNPAVAGYDLLNEPSGAPDRTALWELYHRCYQTIRAADPEHIIFVEGCWAGHVGGQYVNWGWDVLPPPAKSGWKNVVYEMHGYDFAWDDTAKQMRNIDNQLNDWKMHKSWSVPCYEGEFNAMSPKPDPTKVWKYAVEKFTAAGMSWSVWTYKATHGSGDDSWGVYNPRDPKPAKPNLQTDTADEIRRKWSEWRTAKSFAINPMLKRALAMPLAKGDAYSTVANATLSVEAPGVLENDKDLNLGEPGIALEARLVTGPAHGKLKLNKDGSFAYTPTSGFSGLDTFHYRVFDGHLDSATIATVKIEVTDSGKAKRE